MTRPWPWVLIAIITATAALTGPVAAAPGSRTLSLKTSEVIATGTVIHLKGTGAKGLKRVAIERASPGGWRQVATAKVGRRGAFRARFRPRGRKHSVVLRARSGQRARPAAVSKRRRVRIRDVRLAAVGDINLGDGVASYVQAYGRRYPWRGVAEALRGADIAYGNLECAVSRRGSPEPKTFTFRGSPAALRTARRYAGLDVVDNANNHSGDFGHRAFFDTLRFVDRLGLVGVGGGKNLRRALRPRIVTKLGLRVAFVGFENILPASFWAGGRRPGVPFASAANVHKAVRAARRRADVVIAVFHWGIELAASPDTTQRALAHTAIAAGADAVIGAHPHVLQPIRRSGHHLVAYSLGNFIFTAASQATTSTGILNLRLSTRGVEGAKLRRATIVAAQPRLR